MTVLERLEMTSEASDAMALLLQGLDVRRLRFMRWLVLHGRDPEWVGVKGL